MSAEMFGRAQNVMKSLQSSEDFEHIGRNSRGIRVQTESLLSGITNFAAQSPDLTRPIILVAELLQTVSADFGTYVRVKGGPTWIDINVRGLAGSMDENSTPDEIRMFAMRRSGVHIDVYEDGRSNVTTDTACLKTTDGRRAQDVINEEINKLSQEQKARLAAGLVDVVTREIALSGEFLDLQ